MTEDTLVYLDILTGYVSAALLFGVVIGFIRAAVGAEGERLRMLSIAICLFAFLALIECIRVRPITTWVDAYTVYGRLVGTTFNVLCGIAAYCSLKFLWLAIPEQIDGRPERENWSWYTSPLYPPWGIPGAWRTFMDEVVRCLLKRRK